MQHDWFQCLFPPACRLHVLLAASCRMLAASKLFSKLGSNNTTWLVLFQFFVSWWWMHSLILLAARCPWKAWSAGAATALPGLAAASTSWLSARCQTAGLLAVQHMLDCCSAAASAWEIVCHSCMQAHASSDAYCHVGLVLLAR